VKNDLSRRSFVGVLSAGAAAHLGRGVQASAEVKRAPSVGEGGTPALLGGTPVRTEAFPSWPIIAENDKAAWREVLLSGRWNRGPAVARFEQTWAEQLGCPFAIATASGTAALFTCLNALGVGPGDEVIVPPYTFVATINVVLLQHALPIFVDTDRATCQIDADRIEGAVTSRTRCIIPVHLGGNPADLDKVLSVGRRHGIPVLEDACQAHFAEWRGKKVGTLGDLGCFSFQASKNLNSGEGGAIVSHNGELMAVCAGFHDAGRGYRLDESGRLTPDYGSGFSYALVGDNRRLTEFQATLLHEQLTRLEEQSRRRESNAAYLTSQLREIPGIHPAEMYEGATRNAYHLYMFRYDPAGFVGLPRSVFLRALRAEGVPCSAGYGPLNKEPFIGRALESRGFRSIYGDKAIAEWAERNQCPENDKLCQEACWFTQTMLLGSRSDMDDIAAAIRKIRKHGAGLRNAEAGV